MYDCVIAAAGGSTRMGSPKQLLPVGLARGAASASRGMAETVAAAALDAGCRVLLVVGCRAAEVRARFAGPAFAEAAGEGRLLVVENAVWEEGMLGSIQAALPLVLGEAFFSMNADMPLVGPGAYRLLAEARDARNRSGSPGALPAEAAFFASHRGEAGHPVLVPSAWIPEILGLPRSGRMRSFLDARPRLLVEAGSDAVLVDVDTPQDYESLHHRFP